MSSLTVKTDFDLGIGDLSRCFRDLSYREMPKGRNVVTISKPVPFLTPTTRGRHLKPNHGAQAIYLYLWEVPRCVTVFENNCILCVSSISVKIKSRFF